MCELSGYPPNPGFGSVDLFALDEVTGDCLISDVVGPRVVGAGLHDRASSGSAQLIKFYPRHLPLR
jgi:hypothetical protein